MTVTMIDLPEVIARSDDADFLRGLIEDGAQRLMEFDHEVIDPGMDHRENEVTAVCVAGHGACSPEPENQRNGE